MLFKNILVPYDGSKFSNRAFKVALIVAQKYNSKITIVSCINIYSADWFGKSTFEITLLKKLRGKIMKEIQVLEKIAKKKDVRVKGKIIECPAITKALTSYAKSNKIDLIVIGSHGRSGLDKFFLGSISNGVLQRASCPVLVVK